MFFPMTDDEKIARDWINAVERNRVREVDIYPQLKAWVHQISATDGQQVGWLAPKLLSSTSLSFPDICGCIFSR